MIPTVILNPGDTGPYVSELQTDLNKAGASPVLTVDGNYGPLTYSAVVAFKHRYYLEDGIIGPVTWTALEPATPPPPPSSMPVGPTGNWKLAWADEFTGTSVDTSRWIVRTQWMNQVTCTTANATVANGHLSLKLSDSSHGSAILSDKVQGDLHAKPSNGYAVSIGQCVEARILLPGSGSTIYNWPAFWIINSYNGAGVGMDEIDIAEGLGQLTTNYHYQSSSNYVADNGPAPTGTWAGGYHTYTCVRNAASFDVYWDGKKVWSQPTHSDGVPMAIILNNGNGQYGGPLNVGASVLVDYVRVWSPA